MHQGIVRLRPYTPADEDAVTELWHRTWKHAMPHIDLDEKLQVWRQHWHEAIVQKAAVILAEVDVHIVGFVTIDRETHCLDQLVVAPEHWGGVTAVHLLSMAKWISPCHIDLKVSSDNKRAIRFYRKQGFKKRGKSVESGSDPPQWVMRWRPPRK